MLYIYAFSNKISTYLIHLHNKVQKQERNHYEFINSSYLLMGLPGLAYLTGLCDVRLDRNARSLPGYLSLINTHNVETGNAQNYGFLTMKMFYYRGLKEWNKEKGYLMDTCLMAQDRYKTYLDYFRIAY